MRNLNRLTKKIILFSMLGSGCEKLQDNKTKSTQIQKSASSDAAATNKDAGSLPQNPIGAPLEATLESVTSTVDGREPTDLRLISNIYSLALNSDPYFDHLGAGVNKVLKTWTYNRDPSRKIVLSINLTSVQQAFEDTDRNFWWIAGNVHQVVEYSGVWALNDVFTKLAKNAAGEQWNFNYKITKIEGKP